MKNRRNIIIAFLLCATLIVGVGYAAVAEQLTVDGTASYHKSDVTGLDGVIHFTGNALIVNAEHNEVTNNDAIILNVTAGTQNATIDANFTNTNVTAFHSNSQYLVGVIFEVEIDNSGDGVTEALELTFGQISISGEVGIGQPFGVSSAIKDGQTNAANTLEGITVNVGDKATVYLHVQLSMLESIVTNNTADVADTAFKVVLPIQKVEAGA